jgi:hypothetical protein
VEARDRSPDLIRLDLLAIEGAVADGWRYDALDEGCRNVVRCDCCYESSGINPGRNTSEMGESEALNPTVVPRARRRGDLVRYQIRAKLPEIG